ncbi:hypothetical protein BDZ94DRAFT_1186971 [Collybia nuda]|uniref:DUF6534 domain-containing protein n=1 Tax=Collybia nuda TaxID=64659 RepID=A0A9P5YCL7_9AGAR|nr:hypothetical protein BDZ94DRAFT_1186971 [Collybia nuda]
MEVTKIAGPLLIGTMISCGLYGILCVQAYIYHTTFPHDPYTYRIMVYIMLVLETAQTLMLVVDSVDALATHHGNVVSLDSVRMYWFSGPILCGIVTGLGQLFFAYRLQILIGSWVPALVIALLVMCSMGAAMTSGALLFSAGTLMGPLFEKSSMTFTIWHWTNIVCDTLIVVCMVFYLTHHQTVFNSGLYHYINHLIRLVIETGMATAFANALCFVLYTQIKHTTCFIVPYMMTPKLYSNTMLLILNNRIGRESSMEDIDRVGTTITDKAIVKEIASIQNGGHLVRGVKHMTQC